MDKAIRERWTTALRSGKYTQGKFRLRDEFDEYCCLGVLCDITKAETGGHWRDIVAGSHIFSLGCDEDTATLPFGVANILGISRGGRFELGVNDEDGEIWLTALNDEGFTFAQIADVIDYFFSE